MMMNRLIILCLFALHITHSAHISSYQKQLIVNMHNEARRELRYGEARGKYGKLLPVPDKMPDIRWGSSPEGTASAYAATCGRHASGTCPHSSGWSQVESVKRKYGLKSVGENIGCPGWRKQSTLPDGAVKHWIKLMIEEAQYYEYGTGFGAKWGHYFQIIKSAVTEIGCGAYKCDRGWWMVCHYSPAYKGSNGKDPYDEKGATYEKRTNRDDWYSKYVNNNNNGYNPQPTPKPVYNYPTPKPVSNYYGSNDYYNYYPTPKPVSNYYPTPKPVSNYYPTPRPVSNYGSNYGSNYDNICISNLHSSLNRMWNYKGYFNGKPYYKTKDGSYFLFSCSYDGRYAINTRLRDPTNWKTYGYCGDKTAGVKCNGQWIRNGVQDTNVRFTSCSAFTLEELECIKHYAKTLYFYETTSEDPSHVFTVDPDEGCIDSEPVYKYMDDEAQHMLYSGADIGVKWRMDSIYNISGYQVAERTLVCPEMDLYDCVAGHWYIQSSYMNDTGSPHNETVNGTVVTIGSAAQNVFTYDPLDEAQIKAHIATAASSKVSPDAVIVAVVSMVAVLVIVGAAFYVFHRHRSKHKNIMKQMEVIEDDEEEEEEEEEQEITAPVNTN